MFQKDDLIIYGDTGVCRVEAVGTPADIPVSDKNKLYYTLTPVRGRGVVYTPVDSKVYMRPVMTRQEAEDLIARIPSIREAVYDNQNLKLLSSNYQASLQTHRCEDLICLIKTVYAKNQAFARSGKRLGQIDQRYWKRAEELLYGELSAALDIPFEAVQDYIARAVEKQAEAAEDLAAELAQA